MLLSLLATFYCAYSQNRGDTLSMSNYQQKATDVTNFLNQSLSFSAGQKDSVNKIFQQYYLSILQIKKQSQGGMLQTESLRQLKFQREINLRKVLTPIQYGIMQQNQQMLQDKRKRQADSLYQKHHIH